jgi:transposase
MNHIQGVDRNQISIFALEEIVAKDSWARLIDVFVDALPLENLGFESVQYAEEGRPPYHPGDMLKLYMYGHKYGIRSNRKLEHAAHVNIEMKSPRTNCTFGFLPQKKSRHDKTKRAISCQRSDRNKN